MKRTRHSPEQIIATLREADALLGGGVSIGQVCQKPGVAEATFHRWRNQYGGMNAAKPALAELDELVRLKAGDCRSFEIWWQAMRGAARKTPTSSRVRSGRNTWAAGPRSRA